MTKTMKNNGDIFFGAVGTGASAIIATYHQLLGALVITIVCGIMLLRLRKEWRNRDK